MLQLSAQAPKITSSEYVDSARGEVLMSAVNSCVCASVGPGRPRSTCKAAPQVFECHSRDPLLLPAARARTSTGLFEQYL